MTIDKPELSIVILSYNVQQLLSNCLESLFSDIQSKHWQIIVVDNASTDDSIKYLKKHYPQIQLIISSQNVGFSSGNNLALPHIESDYVLFLNPDTETPSATISFVLDYLKTNSQVGAATCKILLPNGNLDDGCHRGFPTPWNSFCHFTGLNKLFPHSKWFSGYWQGYKNLNTPHEIDALTGAFIMLPTRVGKQLNWWDEDYFFNGEDLDFCYRIREAGYQIMYLPQVTITHFKGASGGYKSTSHGAKSVSKEIKLQTARASTQAMKLFYQKHYQTKYPLWLTWLTLTGIQLLEKYRLSKIT